MRTLRSMPIRVGRDTKSRPSTAPRLDNGRVQALDRTQPLLPMAPGQAERQTHDYVRHGTTSLFAALNVATGEVIGKCHRRHRHPGFLKLLDEVDAKVPKEPGVGGTFAWRNRDRGAQYGLPAEARVEPGAGPDQRHLADGTAAGAGPGA